MNFDISYTFFLSPEISLIPTIINIGKTSAGTGMNAIIR